MEREVQPELLDKLPPDDPRARRSRCDLRRVNAWLGSAAILARALRESANGRVPGQILELGAGDGQLLLHVARTLAPLWPNVEVTLLDRQPLVDATTLAKFAALGWRAETRVADVFDGVADRAKLDTVPVWSSAFRRFGRTTALRRLKAELQTKLPDAFGEVSKCTLADRSGPLDIVIANLFLHHFSADQLTGLFGALADRASLFVALEPRRGAWPLFGSRLLGLIGCNAVTRHDARVSVRAGFAATELSSLWPPSADWELSERSAGLFSHVFVARRKN